MSEDNTAVLTAHKGVSGKDGGCNFCTRSFKDYSKEVWVLRSKDPNRRQVVAICPECLNELKAATRES